MEKEQENQSCYECLCFHFENSSLFIFPLSSTIRQACLMCITNEEDAKKEEDELFEKKD
jgi:hypothetical protein